MSAEMQQPLLLKDIRDGVATLTLNRPSSANTLSEALMDALEEAVLAADGDESVQAIVVAANGKIFCAGHDLGQMHQHNDRTYFENLFARCSQLMLAVRNARTPVIAKVQGAAVAAGCQLVASCDLAYAADHAKFGVNGINLGLFCSTPSVALSRTVLPKQAMELLLTGQLIDAKRAAEIGLINRAVPAAQLDETVQDAAKMIANKHPAAIRLGKDLFYRQLDMDEKQAYGLAASCMAENIGFEETQAMISDFLSRSK